MESESQAKKIKGSVNKWQIEKSSIYLLGKHGNCAASQSKIVLSLFK